VSISAYSSLPIRRGFFEAFHQTFQLAALLAFVAAGLLALLPSKIGNP
jgi:hypothetical protein